MNPYYRLNGSTLYQGHILDVLPQLPAESVQCIVTSPPYWGLRDYGLPPLEWGPVRYAPMAGMAEIEVPGCVEGCEHVWGEEQKSGQRLRNGTGSTTAQVEMPETLHLGQGQYCQLCGGWRGCLGLEPTVEMFVGHIVLIWRELWRVLRDDGCCWLNLGDSYSGSGAGGGGNRKGNESGQHDAMADIGRPSATLKPKDLIGIPWRVAFALQADGWYLRSDIVWAKGVSFCDSYSGSCMPESVRDRPTKGHEYVFLLSKNKRYFYDGDAVREQGGDNTKPRPFGGQGENRHNHDRNDYTYQGDTGTRNLRSVWTHPDSNAFLDYCAQQGVDLDALAQGYYDGQRDIKDVFVINPGSYAGAHFATFPPKLVEPMIKAGTSAKGCCPECGAPWERVTERKAATPGQQPGYNRDSGARNDGDRAGHWTDAQVATTGWTPTCDCNAGDPIPCTVLDPFGGSGTTAEVAIRLQRRVVLVELSRDYCDEHIIPRLEQPIQIEML